MPNQKDASDDLLQLKAALRKNLDAMGAIAARMVVLKQFREAVLPHLPPSAALAALEAFDWSLEESLPIAADFASLPAYSDAFLEEAAATRAAIRRQQGHREL